MSFALFLLYLILTFLRPGEQIPQLRQWAVMDIVSGLALAAAGIAVLGGRGVSLRAAQVPLLFGLWASALLSVLVSPSRSLAALEDVLGFGKSSVTAFLLVVINVSSEKRLRTVAIVLSLLTVIISLQAAFGYQIGVGRAPLFLDTSSDTSRDASSEQMRVRGVGLFGDPNDLAITLIAVLPLCLALRRKRAPIGNTVLAWIPIALITYTIRLTRSRGGLLALAAVIVLSLRHRIGTAASALAGVGALMAFIALGFLGGRSLQMDQSAMGRIWAWSAGLEMLKSSPVWGVGFNMFTLNHHRAAHSSFVQCFAELGLLGYLLWLAVILLTLDDMRSVEKLTSADAAGLQRWGRALAHSLAGALVGGIFLTRAYDVTLFIQLGLGTALADIARRQGGLSRIRNPILWTALTGATAVVSILAVWLYMRFLR